MPSFLPPAPPLLTPPLFSRRALRGPERSEGLRAPARRQGVAVGVTSPEALRSPSLVACTSSPFHFRVLPGCASSSEMSKRSEGPSAARVCERQQDVEAPVSDTVRGTLRESLIVAPAPRCCVGPGCQWVHAGSGSVAGRRAGCPQIPRLRGPLSPQGPWCPMLSRQESSRLRQALGFLIGQFSPRTGFPHWLA